MTTATARYATNPLTLTGGEKMVADKSDATLTGGTLTQAIADLYKGTKGADLASAATVTLANATGNYNHVTGTTTITSFGSASAGLVRVLIFDGALTLTHNATSLILLTSANITTAAGDSCVMFCDTTNNWRMLSYSRASGQSLGGATIADGDKGDVTVSSSGATWTLDNDVVTNAKLANVATQTIKGRASASTGDPEDLTPAQARAVLGIGVQSVTSSATVTPTFADDIVDITAQAAALALANPTGTAVDGWGIVIRIKDNGTARAITYGTQYRAVGVTLPTTTVISKTLYLGMIYNSGATKWDVVSVSQEV